MDHLTQFIDNLKYWLKEDQELSLLLKVIEDDTAQIKLLDGEGDSVGWANFLEDEITVQWIGSVQIGHDVVPMVALNGLYVQAIGRPVAAWLASSWGLSAPTNRA